MNTFSLAPLILILPLAGLLINGLVGRRFVDANRTSGERLTGWLATLMVLGAFVVSVTLFISLATNGFEAWFVPLFNWIDIPAAGFQVNWTLQVDTLSVTMMLVVTGVGSLIHIYAIGYMHGDPDFSRFFTYFNLFIFFMLILVSGSSYLVMFVGWEGVGLCSYLLISFWWDRLDKNGIPANANAGRKAMVMNRIGDFGVLLAMFLLFWTFGTLDYKPIFEGAASFFEAGRMVQFGGASLPIATVLTAVTALFLLGVAGKSAQIPLYTWLPDAMAGPTPVSALIHAATMVTAGVYLLVRSNVLYEIVRESGTLILGLISTPDLVAWIGALTAFFAGLIAFSQNDIKKVLAYSTVSQLGFMVAAAGMGAYVAAMFHLITHAFFKALLFLGSGSVIHGMEHGHHEVAHGHEGGHDDHAEDDGFDPQDMRYMGGLRHRMRTTYIVYMIGALALAGIFPLAGFWSKDEILLHAQTHSLPIYIVLALAALGTAFYVGRQLIMTFFGAPRHAAAEHAHESPPLMTRPLVVLAILAALGGLLNVPYLSAATAERNEMHPQGFWLLLEQWEEHSIPAFELSEEGLIHLPHTPVVFSPVVAGTSLLLALAGLGLAYLTYRGRPKTYHEPDRLARTPIWWWSVLPLNSLYSKGFVPLFNRFAAWLAYKVDWAFWHDFIHDRVIRDMFVAFADFSSNVLDAQGVDGLVNGAGAVTKRLAGALRMTQTGYARTYALAVFLGAVGLLVYFLVIAN
ncbi:MAG: NADH-quinone oxidoreductase subunit L [Anaerolineae bacterium]|uniref:NADH-quinone oxidoreductase subunit L n=1 Tax=Promineifilum sp. TaxID=2664178 RepID=UPI001DF6FCD1|nr:NADH-quinone oxidoreductase subunit L [Anaerolineales bacterium]MCO5181347.1 NADH-quinone oxidoreductase subunit L [Promineifilum sp.]MCW5848308.1 NADH-quinone oxidoreductase subunit L [Anaerolineae bacterium]